MPARRQPQREQQAAGEGADAVDAGEQTDAFGAKQQPVCADHRDHTGEGPGEDIVDDGDRHDRTEAAVGKDERHALPGAGEHGSGTGRGRDVALHHQGGGDGRRVQCHAQQEGTFDTDACQQHAAGGGPHHAAHIAGADIERHGDGHAIAAHDFAHHHAPQRIVGGPAAAVDETGDGEVPDFQGSREGDDGEQGRGDHHEADDAGQGQAAVEPFGEGPEEGAEKAHRNEAEHRDHGNDQGGAGLLIDDDAHGNRFQPAHGGDDEADVPQAPEIHRTGPHHLLKRTRRVLVVLAHAGADFRARRRQSLLS